MNERLNISDLSALLTEYSGRDKKDTELFLRELIAVVSDGLLEEKLVKVKGLGTFKVIPVEERESVHVNTGERFIIPAHSKFTFSPDKELRELVNKPFAAFETTELNEGVNFPEPEDEVVDEEDEEREEESEVEVDVEEDMKVEDEKEAAEPQIAEQQKSEVEDESLPELPLSESVAEPIIETVTEVNAETESELEQELDPNSNPEVESEPEQLPEKQETVIASTESEEVEEKQQEVVPKIPVQTAQKKEAKPAKKMPKKKNSNWFLVTLLLLVLVIGGFFIFNMSWKGQNKQSLETVKQVQTERQTEAKEETAESSPSEITSVEKGKEEIVPAEQPASKEIVKEKIVPDTRLTLISLKHYGHKVFWVYIYEHNKSIIDNPNNISIGTELIIPDASLYGIDAKSPESIAKAKAKQAEINSKF